MSAIAAGAIVTYQRYISPRKGFRCAHCALHGGPSCSEFARRLVLKRGVGSMSKLLLGRFRACHEAAVMLKSRGPVIDYRNPRTPKSSGMHPYPHSPPSGGGGDCGAFGFIPPEAQCDAACCLAEILLNLICNAL